MNAFLNRIWGLRSGELPIVLILGVALLGNSLAQKIAELASISNFLTDVGVPQFLLLLIVSSVISIGMTGVQSLLVDRFNRITLLNGICFGFGLSFIFLRCLFIFNAPNWLNYSLFYLLAEQQFIFFPLAFWLLANDLFEPQQSQRLFSLISVWGLVGNVLGIGIAALSPSVLQRLDAKPEELLILNALIYLAICSLLQVGLQKVQLRKTQVKIETLKETLMEGWEFIREVPAFRYLTFSMLGVMVCENIIDFQFLTTSELTFSDSNTYQTFLSLFTLTRVVSYLTIQSFFTQRLITKLNLKNAFLIAPLGAVAAATCVILNPSLWGSAGAVALQKLPQYTVDETARKSFQGFVPEERRGRVSLFMDSYLVAGSAIIAALITGIILLLGGFYDIPNYFYIYLGAGALAALIAVAAIIRMRTVYDTSLLNWHLKRRQRSKSILDKLDF